jgi:hypothetical protein
LPTFKAGHIGTTGTSQQTFMAFSSRFSKTRPGATPKTLLFGF